MAWSTQFINSKKDMDWLFEVHLKTRQDRNKWHSAVLTGNEDCPFTVDLYKKSNPHLLDKVLRVIDNYEPCDKDVSFKI